MLENVHGIFMDLDGCMFRGNSAVPNVGNAISAIKAKGIKVIYLTNNASRSTREYVEHFTRMGLHATEGEFYTSGMATAEYLYGKYGQGRKIYVLGSIGLKDVLSKKGFVIVDESEAKKAEFVVLCLDYQCDYKRLRAACYAIQYGAKFVATNLDRILPVEDGYWPGAGAISDAITSATGVKPFLIGKPSKIIVDMALKHTGFIRNEVIMVGDKVETDIIAAKKSKIRSILVLTGITKKEDLKEIPVKLYPDLVLESVNDIPSLI